MSQGGAVLLAGRRCPVLAVSANCTLVAADPAPALAVGDPATLLGRQGGEEITAGEFVRLSGGNVYRLLAAIPRHVARLWN
jgi:alanine racemase